MKFTSEDLLKAMGLKLGDKIRVYKKEHKIILNPHSNIIDAYCEEVNSSTPLYIFVDEEIEIIQPKPKLTEDEKVILRNLSKELKFISRDSFQKGGNLNLFKDKPERNWVIIGGDGYWVDNRNHMPYYSLRNFNHLFQFIKWEDEPYPIEELLKD